MRRALQAVIHAAGLAACLVASPATAQEFEVMGTIEATIDGAPASFWIPFFPEENEAYATLTGPRIMAILSVDAFSGVRGEDLDYPRLSLGIMRPGPQAVALDLQLFRAGESERMHIAEDGTGTLSVSAMTVDGDRIVFDFAATAVAVEMATFEPLPATDPIEIRGRAELELRGE